MELIPVGSGDLFGILILEEVDFRGAYSGRLERAGVSGVPKVVDCALVGWCGIWGVCGGATGAVGVGRKMVRPNEIAEMITANHAICRDRLAAIIGSLCLLLFSATMNFLAPNNRAPSILPISTSVSATCSPFRMYSFIQSSSVHWLICVFMLLFLNCYLPNVEPSRRAIRVRLM